MPKRNRQECRQEMMERLYKLAQMIHQDDQACFHEMLCLECDLHEYFDDDGESDFQKTAQKMIPQGKQVTLLHQNQHKNILIRGIIIDIRCILRGLIIDVLDENSNKKAVFYSGEAGQSLTIWRGQAGESGQGEVAYEHATPLPVDYAQPSQHSKALPCTSKSI